MSSAWLIYSGALVVLLSAVLMMFMGRPVTPAWRDTTSMACGVITFAVVCALALLIGAPAQVAVSGACFWMAGAITGTNAVRGRIGSPG
ncbi:hypothetical protein GCM10009837_30940 [Streptomyces durmitorensis]|uniref:Uncharacterized protein n=1 Tax=Streptomyces durmitorensis TaxID=319947 RepID=A0ABY4PZY2_9ACTN|nr:hypothetical protein [Streptomyces durmitorensis]UQT58829.1 hypothetical protein M4V62_29325 [Streptomyces durmitorensis]